MKKQKNSISTIENPPKRPRYYCKLYCNLEQDYFFRQLSCTAKNLFNQLIKHQNMPLGIAFLPIELLALESNVDPNQLRRAMQELETEKWVVYEYETGLVWIPRYFDVAVPPGNGARFSSLLRYFFIPLPWSPIKKKCGESLRRLAKQWGPSFHVMSRLWITPYLRKPGQRALYINPKKQIKTGE